MTASEAIESLDSLFKTDECEIESPKKETRFVTWTRNGINTVPKDLNLRMANTHHSLWGELLWNAAKEVAILLDTHPDTLCKNKNILELGAGVALPSCIAALQGAKSIVVTDWPDQELLENIRYNIQSISKYKSENTFIEVKGYKWNCSDINLRDNLPGQDQFQLIIMADLIFNHFCHKDLVKTCEEYLDRDNGIILCFFTHHRPHKAQKDLELFDMFLEAGLHHIILPSVKHQAMFEKDQGSEEVRATVHRYILSYNKNALKSLLDCINIESQEV